MKTPVRNLRLTAEEWERVQNRAQLEGITASDVMRAAIAYYTAPAENGKP